MNEAQTGTRILTLEEFHSNEYQPEFYREMSFDEYWKFAQEQPEVSLSAYQRFYRAILSRGVRRYNFAKREFLHYDFFDDPFNNGKDAVFGIDKQLAELVATIEAGARRLGPQDRLLLLHGPVGSSKSTIARLLRVGLQEFTKTDDGQLYTYSWRGESDQIREIFFGIKQGADGVPGPVFLKCPIHEDPFRLFPNDVRRSLEVVLNERPVRDLKTGKMRARENEEFVRIEGDPCPLCRFVQQELLKLYKGDWKKVLREHLVIRRLIFSEVDRIGLGSFRPKDEKNQDSTELSGDINYRKIAEIGAESDPRAFNFDGEFQVAERGFFWVEEIFKLDKAFLYDFLGATQEHKIKPKRFPEMHLDTVLMGGTNNPEYEKLRDDDTMEAFRDRTVRIDIPYVLKLSAEEGIYDKTYGKGKTVREFGNGETHIVAPHTVEMASLWGVLTRLKPTAKMGITLREKAKLYNGKIIPGYTEEHLHDLMKENPGEGMQGVSPRYTQDKLGLAVVQAARDRMSDDVKGCVTWFAVKRLLEEGLSTHSLIKNEKEREEYKKLLSDVDEEFTDIVKGEVQEAIAADEDAVQKLFKKYIDNVVAYVNKEKVKDHRGEMIPPDEKLMQSVEEHAGVKPQEKDEFRARIVQAMGTHAVRNQQFDYKSNETLYRALRLKLFEDRKDTINLATLHTRVVDPEEQKNIDTVRGRMKKRFGYCDFCSTLIMNHVASIFASGGAKGEKR